MMEVAPRQFGFMPGKSTIDAIFIARQLMEKRIERNLESYWGFVDLEKAYDRVPREVDLLEPTKEGSPREVGKTDTRNIQEYKDSSAHRVKQLQRVLH